MNDIPGLKAFRGAALAPRMSVSLAQLLQTVLGTRQVEDPADRWITFARFVDDDRCVAALNVAVLPLMLEANLIDAGAIRSVAVDPEWRGRGLFLELMHEALNWIDAQAKTTLLFTAEPALYTRFGFRPIAQHSFSNSAPTAGPRLVARVMDLQRTAEQDSLSALVARRAPVSLRASLAIDAGSILTNIANDEALKAMHVAALDAVVVFERQDRALTLVDVIAPRMPLLAQILGALDCPIERVTTLFAPDQLGWDGVPVAEETGLMARGPMAIEAPFMLPPTAEF